MPITRPLGRRAARRRSTILLVVVVLLVVLSACDPSSTPSASAAGSPSSTACGPDEVADGGISGSVIDSEGNPLNDIFVLIESPGGFRGNTRTGEEGLFTAPGVSGDFRISTTDIDYRELVREVTVPCGELVDVELVLTPVEG